MSLKRGQATPTSMLPDASASSASLAPPIAAQGNARKRSAGVGGNAPWARHKEGQQAAR
eukprot:CAMPEP_0179193452 /NCGR_PEP_ID=MMETSP0796-20121207/96133_1 /TAXON_ID=73915 /ORGANISM="Pyrodinium bahamense, Strain pbaha01" /LENGTH=58 /DNA_ID=CAMNT_0020897755 /DNA_START=78 /DNA_END=251 /DNA_ORIENTATION=-